MKKIVIADATLRSGFTAADSELGFKEKIEIVRLLDRLHLDIIETPLLNNGKSDVLFLHAITPLFKGIISCPAVLNEAAVRAAYEAVKGARHPRLLLLAPVSTVQMEYLVHLKPPKVLEAIGALTKLAKSFGVEVELSLEDATRAEHDFLVQAVTAGIENGADIINLGDSAGTLFPSELAEFLSSLMAAVPKLKNTVLSVECSDALHMAPACAVACMKLGISQLKTAIGIPDMLPSRALADVLNVKGSLLGMSSNLKMTVLHKISDQVEEIIAGRQPAAAATAPAGAVERGGAFQLANGDDMEAIAGAVRKLGYELSAEDLGKVCEEVRRITCKKREISSRDLDAIVATVALQAPPVYRLKSFVINSGNMMTSMAHVVLEKNGEEVQGFSMGDGPIDAAFISIENIVGRHFELDDFRISAVTEGREAVGSSVVRLRSNGKLYSGKGVSTDIIGAGIRAYVNALNKICYEEEEKE